MTQRGRRGLGPTVTALLACASCFNDSGFATDGGTTGATTTSTTGTTQPTGSPTDASTSTATGGAQCGDLQVGDGEQCDLGPANSDEGICTSKCQINVCGDGAKSPAEACDDGNTRSGDGCSATCDAESCGDGEVQAPEQCDDGNDDDDDECTGLCRPPACGDGLVQPSSGEECDLGGENDDEGTCTTSCHHARCGDDHVGPGEECDDGNEAGGDGCSAQCQVEAGAVCGNGITETDEECDDGNVVDTDACLSGCTVAACGDGIVHAGVEECDDGNNNNGDGCTIECKLPINVACGDGAIDPGEECDDGNDAGGDGCSPTCVKEFRRVFVTKSLYKGNLGGIAGADMKCQTAAASAGLPGTFRAWLSSNESSPLKNFVKSTVPYVRVDGSEIAKNWDDLVDGVLTDPIKLTEFGGAPQVGVHECGMKGEAIVWTNTNFKGEHDDMGASCSSWISDGDADSRWGSPTRTGSGWTTWCVGPSCGNEAALYCFEQ